MVEGKRLVGSLTVLAVVLLAGLVCMSFENEDADARFTANIKVTVNWSPRPIEQGDTCTFSIVVQNKMTNPMTVQRVGVHLEWQAQNVYYEEVRSSTVAPEETVRYTIPFKIADDAELRMYSYSLKVDYTDSNNMVHSEKSDKISDFEVVEAQAQDNPSIVDQWGMFLVIAFIGIIVIIILVVAITLRMRKLKRERQRMIAMQTGTKPPPATAKPAPAPVPQAVKPAPVPVQPQPPVARPVPTPARPASFKPAPGAPTPMPVAPPARPAGTRSMVAGGGPTRMPAKPPSPFGVVRPPKPRQLGDDTTVTAGVCGNCGAHLSGKVCTVCGARTL